MFAIQLFSLKALERFLNVFHSLFITYGNRLNYTHNTVLHLSEECYIDGNSY